MGNRAKALGDNSVAIGSFPNGKGATNANSIAIGTSTTSEGMSSISAWLEVLKQPKISLLQWGVQQKQ